MLDVAATQQGSRTSILELQEAVLELCGVQNMNPTPLSSEQFESIVELSKTTRALRSVGEEDGITQLSQI